MVYVKALFATLKKSSKSVCPLPVPLENYVFLYFIPASQKVHTVITDTTNIEPARFFYNMGSRRMDTTNFRKQNAPQQMKADG